MQTFDQALVKLVKEGVVSPDEARRTATNPHDFDLALHGTLGAPRVVRRRCRGRREPPLLAPAASAARTAATSIGCRW